MDQSLVITVTSTRKGEGKSFIAAQLARTLAAQDKKSFSSISIPTFPVWGEWFDTRNSNGMKEVYLHQSSLQDAIQLTAIPNLDVVSAGESDKPIGHLIATTRTREIISELRTQYDAVIIDTPEVGEYTDAIPFMKWSDLNLYVVRADSDRTELVANAEMVKRRIPFGGSVLCPQCHEGKTQSYRIHFPGESQNHQRKKSPRATDEPLHVVS
jgi:tyrosine-protein kinase Etk/Wzc